MIVLFFFSSSAWKNPTVYTIMKKIPIALYSNENDAAESGNIARKTIKFCSTENIYNKIQVVEVEYIIGINH
jgi:hypothetical protein